MSLSVILLQYKTGFGFFKPIFIELTIAAKTNPQMTPFKGFDCFGGQQAL